MKKFEIQKLFDASNSEYEDLISQEMLNQLCANVSLKMSVKYFLNLMTEFLSNKTELLDCLVLLQFLSLDSLYSFWEYEVSYAQGSELILLPWYDLVSVLDKNGRYIDVLREYSEISWIVSILNLSYVFNQ